MAPRSIPTNHVVFGDVPHQICTLHVIKELIKGVLSAVAKERQRLATSKPKLKRGRLPSKDKEAGWLTGVVARKRRWTS